MEGNQNNVIKSSDGDIKKLMASAVPESTKRSLKNTLSLKVEKVTSRLLIFSPT